MATPNRSIRLSDEAMEFIQGLAVVYGSPDKGILAIAQICTPEVLALDVAAGQGAVGECKPEMVDSLKGVIQNIKAGNTAPPESVKLNARSESIAERRAREAKEHAAALAEGDTVARMVGRDDIDYDLENVKHRSVVAGPGQQRTVTREQPQYYVIPRKVRPLARPHGQTEPKRRREQN